MLSFGVTLANEFPPPPTMDSIKLSDGFFPESPPLHTVELQFVVHLISMCLPWYSSNDIRTMNALLQNDRIMGYLLPQNRQSVLS